MISCNMKSFRCFACVPSPSTLNLNSGHNIVERKKGAKEESSLLPTEPVTEAHVLIKGTNHDGNEDESRSYFLSMWRWSGHVW
jgi:hypothetical protein